MTNARQADRALGYECLDVGSSHRVPERRDSTTEIRDALRRARRAGIYTGTRQLRTGPVPRPRIEGPRRCFTLTRLRPPPKEMAVQRVADDQDDAGQVWLSWDVLVDAEPRLADLEADVIAETPDVYGDYCANAAWLGRGGFKARYVRLVGWHRDKPARVPDPYEQFQATGKGLRVVQLSTVKPDITYRARRAADGAAGLGWLWSREAYDVGYRYLYGLLPGCCDCCCISPALLLERS